MALRLSRALANMAKLFAAIIEAWAIGDPAGLASAFSALPSQVSIIVAQIGRRDHCRRSVVRCDGENR